VIQNPSGFGSGSPQTRTTGEGNSIDSLPAHGLGVAEAAAGLDRAERPRSDYEDCDSAREQQERQDQNGGRPESTAASSGRPGRYPFHRSFVREWLDRLKLWLVP